MSLNEGQGRCQGTARLVIKPVQAVIELGAGPDLLGRTLNAIHHANRHGPVGDFIAVALPQMRMGRNCMLPGHEIEVIGSETSLTTLLGLEGIVLLKRRGMLVDTEIEKVAAEPGMPGAAYIRDRTSEKHTPDGSVEARRAPLDAASLSDSPSGLMAMTCPCWPSTTAVPSCMSVHKPARSAMYRSWSAHTAFPVRARRQSCR